LPRAFTSYPGGEAIGVSPVYRYQLTARIFEDGAVLVPATLEPRVGDLERNDPWTAAGKGETGCGDGQGGVQAAIDTSKLALGDGSPETDSTFLAFTAGPAMGVTTRA
jgi:hypothetical protein